jgi:hypothetical protein
VVLLVELWKDLTLLPKAGMQAIIIAFVKYNNPAFWSHLRQRYFVIWASVEAAEYGMNLTELWWRKFMYHVLYSYKRNISYAGNAAIAMKSL